MDERPTTEAARFRVVPERSADFAHLSLEGLRAYRRALNEEEGRVSYWRRIIQARLDLVRQTEVTLPVATDNLRGVFDDGRADRGRQVLLDVLPINDIPPLPDLVEVWAREPRSGDDAFNQRLARDLGMAEAQLSAYRTALHKRLARATGELIARYREQPALCLTALPMQRRPLTSDTSVWRSVAG